MIIHNTVDNTSGTIPRDTISEVVVFLIEAADLGPNGMSPREFLEWFRDNLQPSLTFCDDGSGI